MTGSLVLSRIDELTEKAKQLSDDDSQNNRTKSDVSRPPMLISFFSLISPAFFNRIILLSTSDLNSTNGMMQIFK